MDRDAFVQALLRTSPGTLKTLWKTRPAPYALRVMLQLSEGARTPAERQARRTLCQLWGIHGQHEVGVTLMTALRPFPHQRTPLLTCENIRLTQRLHEALSRLDTPVDYGLLLDDLTYFGPGVQRRWREETLREPP